LNHFESFWIILNHFESFWIILNHFESFWIILNHFASFWIILRHFESRLLCSVLARLTLARVRSHGHLRNPWRFFSNSTLAVGPGSPSELLPPGNTTEKRRRPKQSSKFFFLVVQEWIFYESVSATIYGQILSRSQPYGRCIYNNNTGVVCSELERFKK
jgi:hypothetical protein